MFHTHFQQKTRKMCQKTPPGAPLTPRDPFFGLSGMCSKWPMPKNAISLFYGVNLRCFVPIFSKNAKNVQKNAPRGPPLPHWPPETHFSVGGGMCSKSPMPKIAISLFHGVNQRCSVPISAISMCSVVVQGGGAGLTPTVTSELWKKTRVRLFCE